jgi:Family of unknown function (DUF5709)
MGSGIFGTDGTDPEEASGVLDAQDTLEDLGGVEDRLDTGWSPAERPWAVDDWGTTEWEESTGESLAGRLARELPQAADDEGDGLGDASDTDGELIDDEVGEVRAGRLVEGDGGWTDVEPELYAVDAGIDSGAASAEEAAVHVVPLRETDRSDDDLI